MQTLPLDRKSPGQSTRGASTVGPRARPQTGVARGAKDGETDGTLAKFAAAGRSPLGALARRLEQLGRELLRVSVEPLAYTAGLLSRLLHVSRRLIGMGQRPRARQESLRPATRTRTRLRKTHRLEGPYGVRGQHEPPARDSTLRSSRARTPRRMARSGVRALNSCTALGPPPRRAETR
jgi:hypothetical protein